MKANEYKLIEMCVDDAMPFIWLRAFKHHPDPPNFTGCHRQMFQNAAKKEIMDHISNWFTFEDIYDD